MKDWWEIEIYSTRNTDWKSRLTTWWWQQGAWSLHWGYRRNLSGAGPAPSCCQLLDQSTWRRQPAQGHWHRSRDLALESLPPEWSPWPPGCHWSSWRGCHSLSMLHGLLAFHIWFWTGEWMKERIVVTWMYHLEPTYGSILPNCPPVLAIKYAQLSLVLLQLKSFQKPKHNFLKDHQTGCLKMQKNWLILLIMTFFLLYIFKSSRFYIQK